MRDERRRGRRRKKCRIVWVKEEGQHSQTRGNKRGRQGVKKERRRGEDRRGRNEMMKKQIGEHDKEEEKGMMGKELEVCQVRRKEKKNQRNALKMK